MHFARGAVSECPALLARGGKTVNTTYGPFPIVRELVEVIVVVALVVLIVVLIVVVLVVAAEVPRGRVQIYI